MAPSRNLPMTYAVIWKVVRSVRGKTRSIIAP